MAYTFSNATLLTYELANNFLGEGLFSLNSRKNISIQGILDNRYTNLDSDGVKESIDNIKTIVSNTFGVYDDIVINGINLGKGTILDVSFPTNNPIRIGEYNYTIEIINNSDFSNAPTGQIYGNYITGITGIILDFDENFRFQYENDGKYNYNHEINIRYFDDNSDVIAKAKDLAQNLFNDNISVGLIGSYSGIYKDLNTKKNYFTETYNLIDKSCSFGKSISIDTKNNNNYTNNVTHNLTFDQNGKIVVEERGSIVSLDNTLNFTAENYFNDAINNSYTRCQNVLNSYANKYNLNTYDSLYNQPFNLGKTTNPLDNSLNYSISYINDMAYEGNLINKYNITITQDDKGFQVYNENGEIIKVGQLGTIPNLNDIKTKYQEAENRALLAYPNFKYVSSSLNFELINNLYSNIFNYSLEKNNDTSIIENDPYFKSLEIKIEDQPTFDSTREYIIPNKIPKNILFLYGNNIEIGQRSISIDGVLNRTNSNTWSSPISFPLQNLKSLAIERGLNLITTESFIDNINYSYNSDYNFSFNLDIKYLQITGGVQ
jgi:hypothetical protein